MDTRNYCQVLMSQAYFTHDEMAELVEPTGLSIGEFKDQVNKSLSILGFELYEVTSDYDDNVYYGVGLIYEDSNARVCFESNPNYIPLFYKFIQRLLAASLDFKGYMTVGDFLDCIVPGMSQAQAQRALEFFVSESYIVRKEDNVTLGPRGIIEFRPLFLRLSQKEDEDVIAKCAICLDYMLSGKRCRHCDCTMHERCERVLKEHSGGKTVCPQCKSQDPFVSYDSIFTVSD